MTERGGSERDDTEQVPSGRERGRDRLIEAWSDNSWRLMGEGRLLLEQRTFDPLTGVAQSTQTLIDGRGERETRTFSARVYTATELLRMLERAGFGDVQVRGP